MILLNLTQHPINVHFENRVETIEPFGIVPRIDNEYEHAGYVNQIPMFYRRMVKTANLPAPQTNVYYIVSNIVRTQNPNRKDLVSPSGYVRDENRRVIGCTGFVVNE